MQIIKPQESNTMYILNSKTDINIDKSLVLTDIGSYILDLETLSESDKETYTNFYNRFGIKFYVIENTNDYDITRFSTNNVLDEIEYLDYNTLSENDKALINNFLSIKP